MANEFERGTSDLKHATRQRFAMVCRRIGISGERAGEVFEDLVQRYSEAHRSYHNLFHIDRMLGWLDKSGEGSDAIELAIWFHDAIYDPFGKRNEAESGEYFRNQLESLVGDQLLEDVVRLILATDPSRSRNNRSDEDLLVDIDLSILGSQPWDYEVYRSSVRSEYASVPAANFNAGRISILRSFLNKRIYATEFFSPLEQQARSNIAGEIAALGEAT